MSKGVGVLVLKKSEAYYLALSKDIDGDRFGNVETVVDIEAAWLLAEDKDYKVIFVDLHYFENIKNNVIAFSFYQKYVGKFILYGSFVQWFETDKAVKAVNMDCFYLRPFGKIGDAVDNIIDQLKKSNNGDNKEGGKGRLIKNGDLHKLEDSFLVKMNHSLMRLQFIAIKSSPKEGIKVIDVSDILYLESTGRYTRIYLKNKTNVLVCKNLGYYDQLFQDTCFLRVHNSFIVNVAYLKNIIKDGSGRYCVLSEKCIVPISNRRFSHLKEYLHY